MGLYLELWFLSKLWKLKKKKLCKKIAKELRLKVLKEMERSLKRYIFQATMTTEMKSKFIAL